MARTTQEHSNTSPFAALSYQEQQDRWMEWRSRQLEYRTVETEEEKIKEDVTLPPLKLPNMRMAEPTRHGELDKVLLRHRQAFKHAGNFQPTAQK
ncbi:MAG: hypothetical protein E7329_07760 [Clostridiales bacterium]|nr:hypothetical protein [Clostridiales bacterium]